MVELAGITFRGLTLDDVFEEREGLSHIVTVNAEFIVRANESSFFQQILNNNISTFDGQIPFAIAKMRNRNVKFEKLPGSELVYHICERSQLKKQRVFLLGGAADSNAGAIEVLRRRYPGLNIDGYSPPYSDYPFSNQLNEKIFYAIGKFSPFHLLVGFGAVKQEVWIAENRTQLEQMGVRLAIGVGGTFDMVSGKFKRAPKYLQKIGLEGLYRLALEPEAHRVKRILLSLRLFRYIV